MITNIIEHRDHYDSNMYCFLTSFFKCFLKYDIANAHISKETCILTTSSAKKDFGMIKRPS